MKTTVIWIGALVVGAILGLLGLGWLNEVMNFVATVYTRLFQLLAVPTIVLVVLGGNVIQFFIVLPLFLLVRGLNPIRVLGRMMPAVLMALNPSIFPFFHSYSFGYSFPWSRLSAMPVSLWGASS